MEGMTNAVAFPVWQGTSGCEDGCRAQRLVLVFACLMGVAARRPDLFALVGEWSDLNTDLIGPLFMHSMSVRKAAETLRLPEAFVRVWN